MTRQVPFAFIPGAFLQFEYTNHRGETAERHVLFIHLQVWSNSYYPEPTLLLHCLDYDRMEASGLPSPRSFSVLKINASTIAEWHPTSADSTVA